MGWVRMLKCLLLCFRHTCIFFLPLNANRKSIKKWESMRRSRTHTHIKIMYGMMIWDAACFYTVMEQLLTSIFLSHEIDLILTELNWCQIKLNWHAIQHSHTYTKYASNFIDQSIKFHSFDILTNKQTKRRLILITLSEIS